MKRDLSQWNPCTFFRQAPEEKAAASTTATALAVPGGLVILQPHGGR
jgi:hypothetical protein